MCSQAAHLPPDQNQLPPKPSAPLRTPAVSVANGKCRLGRAAVWHVGGGARRYQALLHAAWTRPVCTLLKLFYSRPRSRGWGGGWERVLRSPPLSPITVSSSRTACLRWRPPSPSLPCSPSDLLSLARLPVPGACTPKILEASRSAFLPRYPVPFAPLGDSPPSPLLCSGLGLGACPLEPAHPRPPRMYRCLRFDACCIPQGPACRRCSISTG